MDFPITDSIKTDITLFQPLTPDHLWPMVQEFNLGLDKEEVYNRFGKEERYSLYTYNVCKDDIKKSYGEIKSDEDFKKMVRLVYSYNTGVIMILHDIETKERDHQIMVFLFESTINPNILPKVNEDK